MKSVSVIIPNYNGRSLLEAYLPQIFISLDSSKLVSSYEVIVVDDASDDDSVDFVQSEYPQILLLCNEQNMGFSSSINKGIFSATKELVFLLNNDMTFPSDLFDCLCPLFDLDENIFGVFPTIKNQEGSDVLEAQKLPLISHSSINYIDNINQNETSFSFYLCGGNSLIDRTKLVKMNGFNTVYSPFYFEDFDLSLRAWKQGWKCYYTPVSYCLHCHSATIKSNFSKDHVEKLFVRNRLILNFLHSEGTQYWLFRIKSWLKFLLTNISSSRSKKIYRQAYVLYQNKSTELKRIKAEEASARRYSLKEVVKYYFSF